MAEKKQSDQAARTALAAAEQEKTRAENLYNRRDREWHGAMEAQNRAIRAYQEAQGLYLRGIGSTLAEKLEAGRPCPVCGSCEHPAPAKAVEGHVTEGALEALNQAMVSAGEAVSRAMELRIQADQARNQAQEGWNRAALAAAAARKDYELAMERKIGGIDTLSQLETETAKLRRQIGAYEQAESRVNQALQAALSGEQVALAAVETAREEWNAAAAGYTALAAAWQEALAGAGLETEERFTAALMEPEEKQRRSEELIRYRAALSDAREALEEQKKALEGRTAPDMEGLKKALAQAEGESKTLSGRQVLAEKQLEVMTADKKKLSRRAEDYDQARAAVDEDLEFANRLRGRSGVSLQRYVLGVMLTSVTAEANRLLANVYGGRYRLYRSDEIAGSGRKSGLELEVYDSHTNARRSVTTLSGGEKFLVALSLAIGLSTVVQAQGSGIRLEAMFIDEGFGSLDREAVGDALEVLQGIQRASGVVGIISHVEQLAETIPTRIEITKGKDGSRCRICG